jgi:hypothetical protein
MSLSHAECFECPYCMTMNDIGQWQIVDCQICCQPIEVMVTETQDGFYCDVRRDVD